MYDYRYFNNPRHLKDHFEKLDKIGAEVIVHRAESEEYEGAVAVLRVMARAMGLKLRDLEEEAHQISYETGISFVEAAEKVKEKYLR
jgi:ribosome-binding protein aMBF1 (putative translation factor)